MEPFQMCRFPVPKDTNAPHKPSDGPSPQVLIHLTTEQFPTLPRPILNELWPRKDMILDDRNVEMPLLNCLCPLYHPTPAAVIPCFPFLMLNI